MLKFFRKIRQKLLAEGKLKSYVFYAIGEIFLVVVGILIALQINNWNADRKNRLTEFQQLDHLRVDLDESIARQEENIEEVDLKNEKISMVVNTLYEKALSDDNYDAFQENFGSLWGWPGIPLVRDTLDELEDEGRMSLIKDRELRMEIARFRNRIDNELRVNDNVGRVITDSYSKMADIIRLGPRSRLVEMPINDIQSDPRIYNTVNMIAIHQGYLLQNLREGHLETIALRDRLVVALEGNSKVNEPDL